MITLTIPIAQEEIPKKRAEIMARMNEIYIERTMLQSMLRVLVESCKRHDYNGGYVCRHCGHDCE